MKKIFEVAKWEFLEKVKTKAFIISIIFTPLIIIAFALGPTFFSQQEQTTPKVIGLLDSSHTYFKGLKNELERYTLKNNQPKYVLVNLADESTNFEMSKSQADSVAFAGKFSGYLLVLNAGTDSLELQYRSKNAGGFEELDDLTEAFKKVRIKNKFQKSSLDPSMIRFISRDFSIQKIRIKESGEEGKQDFLITFFTSFIIIMLLFILITLSGQMFVRSLVEEKNNRLIEILISSCSTEELLAGKILGLGTLGLFQILIWGLVALALLGAAVLPYVVFENILPMLLYFILGFVFYTAIFVGIGSIVSTEQEAQQTTSYLTMLLLIPIILAVPAIENPNSTLIKVLSFIPFTLPTAMVLRLSIGQMPGVVIASTTLIMVVSIYLTIKISSKIFKIGILSYGKRPSLKEIFRWIKEKN